MTDPIHEALALGQSIWYDGIRRSLLTSGDLERMVQVVVLGAIVPPAMAAWAVWPIPVRARSS